MRTRGHPPRRARTRQRGREPRKKKTKKNGQRPNKTMKNTPGGARGAAKTPPPKKETRR